MKRTLWFMALALTATAQNAPPPDPRPKAAAADPGVLQRGTTAEVTITGERLAGAAAVHVSGDGKVTAELPAGRKPEAGKVVLRLTAAADAELGERELRVMGSDGVSNPLPLAVTLLPVVGEKEPNNRPDQAQRIELPALLLGSIHGGTEIDAFRFVARKGQHLVFNAYAFRLGSKLDVALSLFDASGNEVARDNDTYGLDAMIGYTVPEDGEFVLAVRDALYRGGGDYTYRLEAGEIPWVESIFPLGGQRGKSVEIVAAGRNLPPESKARLDLEADAPLGRREVRIATPFGPSNPRPFEVGTLPEALESEPNDALGQANAVTLPLVVNGRIERPGDVDLFRFTAGDATQLVCEVVANRYGSSLDALLTLADANGRPIAHNDDAANTFADARIDYNGFKKGAEYVLRVRDLVGRGGHAFGYRLTIAPPRTAEPNFSLRFQPDAIPISRGSHGRAWCELRREGGFQGEVSLAIEGLPPGVTADPAVVPAKGPATTFLCLSAAADAPMGSYPVRLVARGKVGERDLARTGQPEYEARVVRQGFLTVLDAPPFTVEALGAPSEEQRRKNDAEVAELEKQLAAPSPEIDKGLPAWEAKARASWIGLKFEQAASQTGAKLTLQEDGSYFVEGDSPATDTFVLELNTSMKGIRAFRLEALPDDRLPAKGPGRAGNGNFVLSEFKVRVYDAAGQRTAVELVDPTVDFAQDGWPVAGTLDGNGETGWAVAPEFGKTHTAIYRTKAPVDVGSRIQVKLEHNSVHAQHVIGRFRISATSAGDLAAAGELGSDVQAVLDTPAEKRTDAQKARLLAYYRTVAPELEELRRRIARLKVEAADFPPQAARNVAASLGVALKRREGFTGDVTISLEGFTAGRDDKTKLPKATTESLDLKPVTLKGGQDSAVLSFKPKANCELGTRTILIRADAKVGAYAVVQYSRPIPLTVLDKAKK